MEWISVEDRLPEEWVPVAGIVASYEAMYACHLECRETSVTISNVFVSEETGDIVPITH